MPPTTSKSKLAGKLGAKGAAAVAAHANDETTYGFIELPGNFQGIAQLKKCYFKEFENGDNKGQFFFRAQAIVSDPVTFATPNGVIRSRGLMTSIQIAICDTTTKTGKNAGKVTTQEDHIAEVLLEMRRLGGETFTDGATLEDLEGLALALEEAQPYFVFSTSAPSGNGKPFHNWHGTRNLPVDYSPSSEGGEAGGMVEENTPDGHNDAEDQEVAAAAAQKAIEKTMAAASASKPGKPSTAKPAPKPIPKAPEPEPVVEEDETPDLDALVEDANNGESETQRESAEKLVELAVEVGIEEDAAREAETWEALAEMIRANGDGTEGEVEKTEAESDEPAGPQEGDTVFFAPTDPKTKKPVKKALQCVITAVNEDGTVNLKSGKTAYKNISPDRLTSE